MLTLPGSFEIITFDVGGKICKVSRDVIDENPHSMLARLVAETELSDLAWSTIFIDRDGDIFAHVLNYLRHGGITLPITIPKDMFLRELEFYGIVPENGTISEDLYTIMLIKSCLTQSNERRKHQTDDEPNNLQESRVMRFGRAGWGMLKELDRKLTKLDEAFVRMLMHWSFPL